MVLHESIRSVFQAGVESENAPEVVKSLHRKAVAKGMSFLDYIEETDPEIRALTERIFMDAAYDGYQENLKASQ